MSVYFGGVEFDEKKNHLLWFLSNFSFRDKCRRGNSIQRLVNYVHTVEILDYTIELIVNTEIVCYRHSTVINQ